jgi:hypothetical protein
MESVKRSFNSRELLRGLIAVAVILGVVEIGYRVGSWWLGAAILLGAVVVVEICRRLHRSRKAGI